MKIDRHNYEEFFILYWDNELTAVQKQAVENFVTQNADLREEFEILGETRFIPDTTEQFREKDFLLNDSFINITNYEEQLLNYIDDEVTNEERKEVEKFVGLNPVAQRELALLQKTKLQPEAVSFPDKSVLYRREEKPVRVISMTWFRVAVAAAIILIVGFTVLQFVNTGEKGSGPDVAEIGSQKNTPVNNQPKTSNGQATDTIVKQPGQSLATVDNNPKKDQKKETIKNKEDQKKVDENLAAVTSIKKPENKNNLPTPRNGMVSNEQKDYAVVDKPVELEKVDRVQTEPNVINAPLQNPDVTKQPELALYIPKQEAKEKDGGGLKEFLRKTTRVFERRTKIQTTTEDNKLLVGAFAVSLK
jgi:hypothetical protein